MDDSRRPSHSQCLEERTVLWGTGIAPMSIMTGTGIYFMTLVTVLAVGSTAEAEDHSFQNARPGVSPDTEVAGPAEHQNRFRQGITSVGWGTLLLPASEDHPAREQNNAVVIESRMRTGGVGLEVLARITIHDYQFVRDSWAEPRHPRKNAGTQSECSTRRWQFPTTSSDWASHMPSVHRKSQSPTCVSVSPADFSCAPPIQSFKLISAWAGYVGAGVQVHERVGISATWAMANPIIHDYIDSGYAYLATAYLSLEIVSKMRGSSRD